MPKAVMYSQMFCPYCARAKHILESKGAEVEEIDVTFRPDEKKAMMARTGRRTVPQIYIGETHVGGCDDLEALERAGTLDALLGRAG